LGDLDEIKISNLLNQNSGVLEDIILHEMTHAWHGDVLDEEMAQIQMRERNITETGHDTPVVSNPYLAFSEGLAEGFEALLGTTTSKLILMTKEQRDAFFGNFNSKNIDLPFLFNRQAYVRKNAYVFNLFDNGICTLRLLSKREIEDFNRNPLSFDMEKRFYSSAQLIDVNDMEEDCNTDSPARLVSKEGFVASLISEMISHGVLVKAGEVDLNKEDKKAELEKGFLLGFRKLVEGIMLGRANTISELLQFYLMGTELDNDQKARLSYLILTLSRGASTTDEQLRKLVETKKSARENKYVIIAKLNELQNLGLIANAIDAFVRPIPKVYIEFISSSRGKAKRINLNSAYYTDVLDVFYDYFDAEKQDAAKKLSKKIIKRIENQNYYNTAEEFIADAREYGFGLNAQAVTSAATEALNKK